MEIAKLNPQQQKIVEDTQGIKLVVSGPGTGKTTTVTHYLAQILRSGKALPQQILAVTFTVKAAAEMRNRVRNLTGSTPDVSTIHAFALKVLREHPPKGFTKDFIVLRDEDALINKTMAKYSLKLNPQEVKEKMALARNTRNRSLLGPGLSEFYDLYMKALTQNNTLDFDALLSWCLWTFENNSSVLEQYSKQYHYLLVDEFQDTSTLQYELLKPLAQACGNMLCVGDYDQSIYGFRGADVNIMLNLATDFPKLKTYYLEENYRCTKAIVESANNLIQNNKQRLPKPHWSSRINGQPVFRRSFLNAEKEAEFVVNRIRSGKKDGNWSDFAVLYRIHNLSAVIIKKLVHENIPYQVVGDKDYFDLQEIKNILFFFRLMANPNSEELNSETASFLRQLGIANPRQVLEDLLAQLFSLTDFVEIYHEILNSTGYLVHLERNQSQQGLQRLEDVKELESFLAGFKGSRLNEFVEFVDRAHTTKNRDAVNLVTIHSAKGMEFDTVFVVGVDDGTLPHFSARGREDTEEERRMLYVAITRAKNGLYVTYPKARVSQGKRYNLRPSRFLKELDSAEDLDVSKSKPPVFIPVALPNMKTTESLRAEAEAARTANPAGPWLDSSGNRWAVCMHCSTLTRDWWSLDGNTNICKCNNCKYAGKA